MSSIKPAHTPTPWRVEPQPGNPNLRRVITSKHVEVENLYADDAALIVRAMNSHAELVAALESLVERYRAVRPQVFGTDAHEQAARAALAKAQA